MRDISKAMVAMALIQPDRPEEPGPRLKKPQPQHPTPKRAKVKAARKQRRKAKHG